jgi:hypothetical protein
MKNEAVIIGYVPMSNYNVNINDYKDISKDKAFQKLINKYYFKELKTLEFKVFKKYKTLISSQKNAKPRDGEFFYTDSASVCTLHLDSIKYTVYISGQDKPSLFWKQIEIFDSGTVTLMDQRAPKYFTVSHLYESPNYFIDAHFFCFNSSLSKSEFDKIISDFGKRIKPELRSDRSNYQGDVKALEKSGIVIFFRAEGSC